MSVLRSCEELLPLSHIRITKCSLFGITVDPPLICCCTLVSMNNVCVMLCTVRVICVRQVPMNSAKFSRSLTFMFSEDERWNAKFVHHK